MTTRDLSCPRCNTVCPHEPVGPSHFRCLGCGKSWFLDSAHTTDGVKVATSRGTPACNDAMLAADLAADSAAGKVKPALDAGDTTVDELVARFRRKLEAGL